MDCLLPMQERRWGAFAPPGGVADQFDRIFQMGRPDNAQSCLSPGSRANLGNVGGGGAEDKNNLMASAPMVTAALGGRATRTFGEPDLGDNKGSHGGSGVHRCCGGYGGGGGL